MLEDPTLGTEANDPSRCLVIQCLRSIVLRLLERGMLSSGIGNSSTKCKLFGQIMTPKENKNSGSPSCHCIIVKKKPAPKTAQNLSFMRAETVLRPL